MAKQTAVQELIKEMESLHNSRSYINPKNALNDCIHLAYNKLTLEREQIEEAFVDGSERGTKDIPFNCEQYFTQTYGGTNE
jgi:hypothetical protein